MGETRPPHKGETTMQYYNRNAPLLDLGPVSSAVIVGVALFIGMPLARVVRWLLRK